MIYIAYLILFFGIYQMTTAIINVVFMQKTPVTSNLPGNESVSVLIPARNEEKNIGNLLNDLQHLTYRNLEIIVFDDLSKDRTAEIVEKHATEDRRIKMIRSTGLPAGWLGKNFACYSLSQVSTGDFLLFLDADVRINGNIIENTVNEMNRYHLGLLSVFPKQIMATKGEQITIPVMNYILLTLLPLIFVRISPFSQHAAANGQYMLFNRNYYKGLQPHEKFKNSAVEDILTARYFKRNKVKVSCMVGDERIKCRMYSRFSEAVEGFSKNVLQFFGNSVIISLLFWSFATFGFIPFLFLTPGFLAVYVSVSVLSVVLTSVISEQNVFRNLLYFFPQQFCLLLLIYKAAINRITKNYEWKNRNIYS